VNTTSRYLNISTCCSIFPLTCRIHCLGRLNRHNASILLELIFVPAWLHAAESRSNACWRHCWEDPRIAVPIRPQKANGSSWSSQQWHPRRRLCYCLSNSYRPGLSKFFGRGPRTLLHNSSRANILRNVIFSGYVTFYLISKFFVNVSFSHYWQNVFCLLRPDENGFAGRIWPAGRSLENPDIDYEEEWWQHTPLLESSTPTLNGCDLTPSTRTQSSERE